MQNDVSPQILSAFLNDAWNRAKDAANTFRDQLVADQIAALGLVKQGSLASVGKNSANQSYRGYGAGSLTQVQIVEAITGLLALYDQLKDKITCEFEHSADFNYTVPDGFDFDPVIADPASGLLSQAILAQSSGVAQLLSDITRLRLPPSLILSGAPPVTTW